MMAFWFLFKTTAVIFLIFWIRSAVPRLRIDQLMSLAWKVLLPLAFLNLVLTAVYLFYGWPNWSMLLMSLAVILGASYFVYQRRRARYSKPVTIKVSVRRGRLAG